MVLHPEAQRKAQEELDDVLGVGRAPNFEDRPNLPYIEALMTEVRERKVQQCSYARENFTSYQVLRWVPIAPIALPHAVAQDDYYGDYLIKKGTLVFGNSWFVEYDTK
jgi:cytochrome P450